MPVDLERKHGVSSLGVEKDGEHGAGKRGTYLPTSYCLDEAAFKWPSGNAWPTKQTDSLLSSRGAFR